MQVEFIKHYQHFPPGHRMELGGGVAEVLIGRGFIRPVPAAGAGPPDSPPDSPPEEPAEPDDGHEADHDEETKPKARRRRK